MLALSVLAGDPPPDEHSRSCGRHMSFILFMTVRSDVRLDLQKAGIILGSDIRAAVTLKLLLGCSR